MIGRRLISALTLGSMLVLLLGLSQSPAYGQVPANDDFADRLVVTPGDLPYADNQVTDEATTEVGEPQPQCGFEVGATVWYEFTPSADMALRADTVGSNFDTVLAVWTGADLGSLVAAGCNDDSLGVQSKLVFLAESGTTYVFQVGGYDGETGDLTFRLRAPSNVGFITGTVTEEGSGIPLSGVCVDVLDDDLDTFVDFTVTDAAGGYSVAARTGSYLIVFADFCDRFPDHLAEWYDDKPTPESADPVDVAAPAVTAGIDAALARGCGGFEGDPRNQVVGTPGDDVLEGTPGDDLICAFSGDDTISGAAGDDLIFAGPGADAVVGGGGNDLIVAEGGRDVVKAGAGKDQIFGWGGDDVLDGGAGKDRIYGDWGADVLRGRRGPDFLRGDSGPDRLLGGPGKDRCVLGPGKDVARSCESRKQVSGAPVPVERPSFPSGPRFLPSAPDE